MNLFRSLILLMLVSALGSTNPASSMTAVDGYLDNAGAQQTLLPAQDHEGDEPEGVSSSQLGHNRHITVHKLAQAHGAARVANYSDFHSRAPPYPL